MLYKAHQNGTGSLNRQSLIKQVHDAHGYSQKTVDNSVGPMVSKRHLVRPTRGWFALAPSTLQRLTANKALYLEGSNREKKQSGPEVLPVPATVPAALNGKSCSSQGTTLGTSETPVIAADRQEFLPVMQILPYQMEDGDDDW